MHDPDVLEENRAEQRADRAAYVRLTRGQRRVAKVFAAMGFTGRQGVVGIAGATIGALEFISNYLLVWPYKKLWQGLAWTANMGERVLKAGIGGITHVTRGALAVGWAALGGAAKAVRFFGAGGETQKAILERIDQARTTLNDYAHDVAAWGTNIKTRMDAAWQRQKNKSRALLRRLGEGFEYYGAIGLYRAARWVLNPRTLSGKPLFGNEAINKTLGLSLAAVGFLGLVGGLTAVGVWAKIAHAQIAASFFTDGGTLAFKIAKQALLQPAITVGLTGAKFVLLPVIAATRQALKSTDLTRGIAHAYNMRLRRKHNPSLRTQDAALKNNVAAAAPAVNRKAAPVPVVFPASSKRDGFERGDASSEFKGAAQGGIIGKFVEHLVEKSSPAFYEAREKYFRNRAKQIRTLMA